VCGFVSCWAHLTNFVLHLLGFARARTNHDRATNHPRLCRGVAVFSAGARMFVIGHWTIRVCTEGFRIFFSTWILPTEGTLSGRKDPRVVLGQQVIQEAS
jgi:hypothetical protein